MGQLWLLDGDEMVLAALHGDGFEIFSIGARRNAENMLAGSAAASGQVLRIDDTAAPQDEAHAPFAGYFSAQGHRSWVIVPLLREGKAIGTFSLGRTEPHPFGAPEVAFVETFVAQAVIAIENLRLFNESA